MRIDRGYRIEECAALGGKFNMRPVLERIQITEWERPDVPKQWVAMASEGSMAVVVPVTLDEPDVPGLFPAALLKEARKNARKGEEVMFAVLCEQIEFPRTGAVYPRNSEGLTYPDLSRVVPDPLHVKEGEDAPGNAFCLNVAYLSALSKALDSDGLRFLRTSKMGPVLVKPPGRGNGKEADWVTPPFGVVMPMIAAK